MKNTVSNEKRASRETLGPLAPGQHVSAPQALLVFTLNLRAMTALSPSRRPSQAAGVPGQTFVRVYGKTCSPAEAAGRTLVFRKERTPSVAQFASSARPAVAGKVTPRPQMVPQPRGRSPV